MGQSSLSLRDLISRASSVLTDVLTGLVVFSDSGAPCLLAEHGFVCVSLGCDSPTAVGIRAYGTWPM
jgi:hypothetical protein